MSHKVYTIYDSKAEAYLAPLLQKTRGEAIRTFSDLVNNPETMFAKHPSDFTLFEIGEWDELKGEVNMCHVKQSLGTAIEFIKEDSQLTLPGVSQLNLNQQRAN